MLLFTDVLYILVRYGSPSGTICLRCLMLTLSGPVELMFCRRSVDLYGRQCVSTRVLNVRSRYL